MASKTAPLRIGRVRAYLRGRVWYLAYSEDGQRRQPRVEPDRDAARPMSIATSTFQNPVNNYAFALPARITWGEDWSPRRRGREWDQ